MLNEAGRIVGEFTVARATEADEFYLFGSLPAEVHHSRWFRHHLPADGSVRFEVLGLGLVGLSVAGPRSRDVLAAVAPDLDLSTEAFPFMTFRRVDLGMIPALVARINYAGDLGYELWVAPRVPARAVRPDHGGRRAARPAAVRDAGADVAAAREELRDVVPRVPADLHAARGRDHALHQARPRVHRPGGARGRAGRRRSGAAARGVRRRARPGRPGRRHRRRADLARRRRSSAGSRRAATATTSGSRSRSGTCRRRSRPRTARAAPASRSRSSGGAGRPGSSPSRCSTRRASGCASDRRRDAGRAGSDRRRRAADRRSSRATRSRSRSCGPARSPGRGGTLCLAGDCGNCLAEVDGVAYVRTCQVAGRPGLRRRAASGRRRCPPLPVVVSRGPDATPLGRRDRASQRLEVDVAVIGGGRAGWPRPRRRERPVATSSSSTPRDGRRGRGDLRRARRSSPGRRPGCSTSTPHEIVVATGAAEIQPVCPGNDLAGLVTARAAERLHAAGVDLGRAVAVGTPPDGVPCDRRSTGAWSASRATTAGSRAVVTADPATGAETTTPCETVDRRPRPGAARPARPDGRRRCRSRSSATAADEHPLPPPPTDGVVCRCMGVDRRRPRGRVGQGLHRARAAQAGEPRRPRDVPGRRLPAPRPLVDRRPDRRRCPSRSRPARRRARSRSPRPPPTSTSTPSGGRRSTTSTSRSGRGWTGSAAGGGRGTTATPSPSTGRSARASRSATSARSASWSSPGRTSSSSWSGSIRATSRTSSPAGRATRCCSTSAATSWTTG